MGGLFPDERKHPRKRQNIASTDNSCLCLVCSCRAFTSYTRALLYLCSNFHGSGTSENEKAGGYVKADGSADINFEIIHKPAVIQYPKHIAPKVVDPSQNQNADAWKYGYRNVGIAKGYENKRAGIYVHHKEVV